VERKLTPEDLVIADAVKPVALAGVMGGFDTMITEKTRNILIESAWWDPGIIRKMSRRHGLHTDASHRFERGADFESTVLSCDRVAELILESGGGELSGGLTLRLLHDNREATLARRRELMSDVEVRQATGLERVPQLVLLGARNAENAAKVVRQTVASMPAGRSCKCGSALAHAILTDHKTIPAATRNKLKLIVGKYVKAKGR